MSLISSLVEDQLLNEEPPLELLIVDQQKAKDLQCCICFNILSTPRQCRNGHLFCFQCVRQCLEQNPHCPQCRCDLTLEQLSRPLFVEKYLHNTAVWCRYHFRKVGQTPNLANVRPPVTAFVNVESALSLNEENETVGTVGNIPSQMSSHAQGNGSQHNQSPYGRTSSAFPSNSNSLFTFTEWEVDPDGCTTQLTISTRENHEATCPFGWIRCPNSLQCVWIRRKDLQNHLAVCEWRLQECEWCRRDYAIKLRDEHRAKCPRALVTCPACHADGIRRGELTYHQNTQCPESVIQCPYGCNEPLLRKQLDSHCRERAHLHLDFLRLSFQTELKKLRQEFESELTRRDKRIAELEKALSAFDVRVIWEIDDWPTARRKSFLQSKRFYLADYAWYFGLYPNGDNEESKGWISIYLFIDTQSPFLASVENITRGIRWPSSSSTPTYINDLPSSLSLPKGKFVNLEYSLTFVNHLSPQDSLRKEFKTTFPILKAGQGWGDRRAIKMSSVTEEFGFLKGGVFRIEADITVKKQFWSV